MHLNQVDGHIGQVTLSQARAADLEQLLPAYAAEREAYHRRCKTFWAHGKGWLIRNDRIRGKAVSMAPSGGWVTQVD